MFRTLAATLLCSTLLPAQDGWKPLFNGKDLTGWSGDPRLWKVENGTVVGETNNTDKKTAANTFLIWQGGEPGDFELEYQCRVTGNNSGVQYRSKVVDAAKDRVITAIELLSPANKNRSQHYDAYVAKREEYLAGNTSLVEIDLHRSGVRPPMFTDTPPVDFGRPASSAP